MRTKDKKSALWMPSGVQAHFSPHCGVIEEERLNFQPRPTNTQCKFVFFQRRWQNRQQCYDLLVFIPSPPKGEASTSVSPAFFFEPVTLAQVEYTYGYWDNEYGLMNDVGLSIGETTCSAKTAGWPVGKPYVQEGCLSKVKKIRGHFGRHARKKKHAEAGRYQP